MAKNKNNTNIIKTPIAAPLQTFTNNPGLFSSDSIITNVKSLTKEEELEYLTKAKGGDTDPEHKYRKLIISAFTPIVVRMCYGYVNNTVLKEDLVQEGIKGLHRAIDRFDLSSPNRFSAYARWWVKHYITEFYRTNIRGFTLPSSISKHLNKLRMAQEELESILCRQPSIKELARSTGFSEPSVTHLLKYASNTYSLNEMLEGGMEDQSTSALEAYVHGDYLNDDRDTPYEAFARRDSVSRIKDCMGDLEEIEKDILIARYGLDGNKPKTLRETGIPLKLTAEWVRILQMRAEDKLKKHIYNK